MSVKRICPNCGAHGETPVDVPDLTSIICRNCDTSSKLERWRPAYVSYEEALQVIKNIWPRPGTYSRLQEALVEIQRLAAVGYDCECQPAPDHGKARRIEELRAILGDSKADRMLKMFLGAHDTFEAKNGDYGDAFGYTLKKHGDVAALTRVTDKFLRVETLLTGRTAAVKDETVEDTILDLGNYCFMWRMERQLLKEVNDADKGVRAKSEAY